MSDPKITQQKQLIADFLKKGEKQERDFLIGAELEYFVVDKNTLRSISYYEENGIENLLKKLTSKGFTAQKEQDRIIGVKDNNLAITLEPGAQFEISLNPQKTVSHLETNYLNFLKILEPMLKERNQELYSCGYHPRTKINQIRIIPKKRYDLMQNYLNKRGSLALNMMKGTASVQVAIDFSSENDFIRKMILASRLTPILSAVFDNSPIFEGSKYKKFCLRTNIWNNCDNERCGVIPQIFQPDFGYEKYAEYLLNLIPIFIEKDGKYVDSKQPFKNIFDPTKDIDKQLNHIFSICFPDVRARNYIELRMTDSLPYPLNFAYLNLVYDIFYNKDVFAQTYHLLDGIDLQQINQAKVNTINLGIKAEYANVKVYRYFQKIISFLPTSENSFSQLLQTFNKNGFDI